MNLNHVRLFDAVASEGNISRAAEKLMVSQPAVSKQLLELERSLGVRVFERWPKGVRLTEAGRILRVHSQRIFGECQDAEREINELSGLQRGEIIVAASMNVGVHLLPDAFVAFRKRHPAIRLSLQIGSSELICRNLADGSAHIGFSEGTFVEEDIEAVEHAHDELIAIAAAGHPLGRARSISAARLCQEPFVVRETGSGTKSMVEQALSQRGLHVRPAMSLGSTEAIKRAVAAGVGVAIVSALSVATEIKARQLIQLRLTDLKLKRPIYRLMRRGSTMSTALRAFLDTLER